MSAETLDAAAPVRAGTDRHEKPGLMIWGKIPLATKVSTAETGGLFYSFEHREMAKGGPPRHVHHGQDEWFYVLAGRYVFEVGEERFELSAGDSLFAPRGIPHAWACVSDEPGTVLTTVSPAGTFERFILETTTTAELPPPREMARHFESHAMALLGPPLAV